MGIFKSKGFWIVVGILFLIYAAKSPDPAATFIRKIVGFLVLLGKGLGVVITTLINLLPS